MEPDDQTIKSDVGPHSESYGGCRRKVIMSNVVTLSEQLFPNTCSVYGALVSTICITKLRKRMKSLMEMINLKESSCLVHRKIAKADSKYRFSNQAVEGIELVRQWCKSSSISIKPLRVLEKTYFLMLA